MPIETHYNQNKEQYKVDFNHDSLWRIKATIVMKQIYPLRSGNLNKGDIELYKHGMPHYEKKLRLGV